MLMSAELKRCVTWFIYFLDLLWLRYNCAKFHHCRICVTDFREGGLLPPPPLIPEQPRNSPSWIGLKLFFNHHACWIQCSIIKIPFRKISAPTLFTDTCVVTVRLLIMVKHATTFLLELQSTLVCLIKLKSVLNVSKNQQYLVICLNVTVR